MTTRGPILHFAPLAFKRGTQAGGVSTPAAGAFVWCFPKVSPPPPPGPIPEAGHSLNLILKLTELNIAMAEAPLSRAEKIAHRRVRGWMAADSWKGTDGFDNPAFERMAEQILGVMASVGPADSTAGIAALTKALALIGHQLLQDSDEAALRDFGDALGRSVACEILSLRAALVMPARRGH